MRTVNKRGRKPLYDASDAAAMSARHAAGATIQELADSYGCSRRTVSETMARHGISLTPHPRKRPDAKPSDLAMSRIRRANAGLTAREIAAADRVSVQSVYATLKRWRSMVR